METLAAHYYGATMKLKTIAFGSFLAASAGLYSILSVATGSVVFDPVSPPVIVASIGGVLMVIGLLMP